jgi:hypothetical protein
MKQSKSQGSRTPVKEGVEGVDDDSLEPYFAPPPDLDMTVDELRAEIAGARAAARLLKAKDAEKGSP